MLNVDGTIRQGNRTDIPVRFTAEPGSFHVVFGLSGAGKTTLLRGLAGLGGFRGQILWHGRNLLHQPLFRRRVGYIPQGPSAFPHWRVGRQIAEARPTRRLDPEASRLIAAVGLGQHADRLPRELSGGQAERLVLARTLASDPLLLLLDEPLRGLDRTSRAALGGWLKEWAQAQGAVIMMATHDWTEAIRLGDAVMALEDGVVKAHGHPLRLMAAPPSADLARLMGYATVIDGYALNGEMIEWARPSACPFTATLRVARLEVLPWATRPVFSLPDGTLLTPTGAPPGLQPGDTLTVGFHATEVAHE